MAIDEVEAIWARIANDDDWSAFDAKIASIRRMGDANEPPCDVMTLPCAWLRSGA